MPRPRAEGLNFFPLDTEFDADMDALLDTHESAGLAFMVTFWQQAYASGSGEIDLSNVLRRNTFAKRARLRAELCELIANDAATLGLIDQEAWIERKIVASSGVKKRLALISDKREKARDRALSSIARKTSAVAPQKCTKKKRDTNVSLKEKSTRFARNARDGTQPFGEWVRLKPEEHAKLCDEFGVDCVTAELARYDTWIGQSPTGKSQKPHTLPAANNYLGAIGWIKRAQANREGFFAAPSGNGGRLLLTAKEQHDERVKQRMERALIADAREAQR